MAFAEDAKARIAQRTAQMDDAVASAQTSSQEAIAAAAAQALSVLSQRNAQTTDRAN